MLEDKDRIFTNLYGWESAGLKDAKKRGDWDGTKKLMAKGRDWIIDEMKKSGYAWARRRRVPNRIKMVIYAERKRSSALFGYQCR